MKRLVALIRIDMLHMLVVVVTVVLIRMHMLHMLVEVMTVALIHIRMHRTLVRHCCLQLVFSVEIMKITGGWLILGLVSLFCRNRL